MATIMKNGKSYILGINVSHDRSVCLLENGIIKYAIAEERLDRIKYSTISPNGETLPRLGIDYVLSNGGVELDDLDLVILDRAYFNKNIHYNAMLKIPIRQKNKIRVLPMPSHHLCHAYSSFYCSPFKESVIFVVDVNGSYTNFLDKCIETESAWLYSNNRLETIHKSVREPGEMSVSYLYMLITNVLGFTGGQRLFNVFRQLGLEEGGKTMGLAPYGKRRESFPDFDKYYLNNQNIPHEEIYDFLLKNSLTYSRSIPYLKTRLTEDIDWRLSFRREGEEITQLHKDLAYFAQENLEKRMVPLASNLYDKTKCKNLCLAGGIFLNSVLNKKILDETPFENIFIQPAATDDGNSIGCAMYGYHQLLKQGNKKRFVMNMPYFGASYTYNEIVEVIKNIKNIFKNVNLLNEDICKTKDVLKKIAEKISSGKIIGFFKGRSEFGPRALGNRSILCDPRDINIKDILNRKVKKRESFRPFAPTVLKEKASEYFDIGIDSPYMLMVVKVKRDKRDIIPGVTHVDGTARIQTVTKKQNSTFYRLIEEFEKITKVPVLLNTSFNIRGEPIVEKPTDALNTFIKTGIDLLFLEHFLIEKDEKIGDEIQLKIVS